MATVDTTVRYLQVGDVLLGSGFVVTRAPYVNGKKCDLAGHYPGKPVYREEWNPGTRMRVQRTTEADNPTHPVTHAGVLDAIRLDAILGPVDAPSAKD